MYQNVFTTKYVHQIERRRLLASIVTSQILTVGVVALRILLCGKVE